MAQIEGSVDTEFRTMADHAPVMMWVTDSTGYCTYLNQRWYDFTGQTRAQAEGFGWLDATHPDDRARVDEAFRSANAARADFWVEYRLRGADGSARWCIDMATPRFARDGAFEGYVGSVVDIHERREAETRLALSEESLRLATDAAEVGSWDLDLVTDTLTWSERTKAAFGISADRPCTMDDFYGCLHPEDREATSAAFATATDPAQRATYDVEYRTVGKEDGVIRWVAAKGRAMFDDEGRCVRALGTAIDITARKAIDERLHASEARMKLAQRAARIGVWDWDVLSGAISWSPEMFELLGLDPVRDAADPYGAWLAALNDEDRQAADAAARLAASGGIPFTVDFRVRTGEGERWVRSQGVAIEGPSGKPARVVGVNVDVTEEHRREAELRSLAGDLQAAVEQTTRERDRIYELSNDLFAVAGFDGYLKTINPAWSRTLGYPDEALLARPFTAFIHPEDLEASAEAIGALGGGESLQRFEDRLLTADGRTVWIAWAAVPDGDRFYAVGRDITAEKQRDEILRQTQKMEAVGQLTGGIAHDFNNLLQAVQGNLDMIRRKPEVPERVARWATNGLQAAERGAKLTSQLLAFSRAQKLELRPVAVAPLLAGMEDLLRRSLGPAIRIHIDAAAAGALGALADPTQLELALLNLAINGRDAMPDGGDMVIAVADQIIANDPELPPGRYVALSVTDHGTGMAPDVAARAFDPFFTTKGVGKGTGLGLSQAYGMARQAGGAVRIAGTGAQGTTVTILLRQAEAAAPGDVGLQPTAGVARGAAPTVLLVDDDDDVRRFLADTLESLGFRVLTAEDGASGLAALQSTPPDLMIVDFAMPGLNGAEVADAARMHRPGLPIVFASGYADTAAIERAVGPGAIMLRKPFGVADLETAIRSALG